MRVSFDLVSATIDACFQPLQHPFDWSGIVAYATVSLPDSLDILYIHVKTRGRLIGVDARRKWKKTFTARPHRKNFTAGVENKRDSMGIDETQCWSNHHPHNGLNFIYHHFSMTPSPLFPLRSPLPWFNYSYSPSCQWQFLFYTSTLLIWKKRPTMHHL